MKTPPLKSRSILEKPIRSTILHEVRLVLGGYEYFALLKQLIDNAHDSIYLQTYIFEDDLTGKDVANALKAAAQRQVKVFLLVDGYASRDLSKSFIKNLEEAGVQFRMFDPLLKSKRFYLGRRLHHKVAVIDSTYALVGGINISDRYNDMPGQPAWLDWAVYTEGEVSATLANICHERVAAPTLKSMVRKQKKFNLQPAGSTVSIKINDWVRRKKQITHSYMSMFRQAKQSIIIMSAYFLPNGQFKNELRKAVKRGVDVKLILAGTSDVIVAKHAERYMYRWLLKNGIKIYEYQKSVLHGKMAVYDGKWATVGSFNVNNISAYASIELNLAVNDPVFAHQVESALTTIMTQDCVNITAEHIDHSSFSTQVVERIAYYIFRVLFFTFTFYFKQRD